MCQNLSGCKKELDSLRDKLANTMKYNDTIKNKISKAEKINSLNVELKDTQRKCYGLQSVIKKLENKCDDLYYAMEQEKKKYLSLKSDYDNIHRDFCKIQQEWRIYREKNWQREEEKQIRRRIRIEEEEWDRVQESLKKQKLLASQ